MKHLLLLIVAVALLVTPVAAEDTSSGGILEAIIDFFTWWIPESEPAGATDGGLGSLAVVGWIFTFGGMIMGLFDAVFVGLPDLISSFGFPPIWVLAVFGSPLLFVAAWGLYGLMTGNQTKGQD